MRASTDRDQLLVLLAGWGGLRCTEIARAAGIDIINNNLLVHGKGRKERLVPIHRRLRRALDAELTRRRAGLIGSGFFRWSSLVPPPEGPFFPGGVDGHLSPSHVSRVLSRLLGPGWAGHSLRHRFGTKALEGSGGNLLVVRDLLGHSTVATTETYTAVPSGALIAAVNAID